MQAELVAVGGGVAVEQGWKDSKRDRRRDEARARRKCCQDAVAELPRDLAVGRQLLVALDQRGGRTGGRAAVFPIARVHDAAELRNISLAQYVGNTDQHLAASVPVSNAQKQPDTRRVP